MEYLFTIAQSPIRKRVSSDGLCQLKRTARGRGRVGEVHAPPPQARWSLSLVRQLAQGDPAGGDDVRPLPLSLRNVEDLLYERGIDICHETVRLWWTRFEPMFAAEIRRKRVDRMRQHTHWRWHVDEVYVRINGEMRYLWRAVDHEGEVLESFVIKERDKAAALKFIKKALKRHGSPKVITTDGLRSYGAAMKALGNREARGGPLGKQPG